MSPSSTHHARPAGRARAAPSWRVYRLARWACAGLLATFCAQPARAQELDVALFQPPPGAALSFTLPEALPARHGTFSAGLALNYASGLLARVRGPTTFERSELGQASALLDVGLFDALSIGLALPVSLASFERPVEEGASRISSNQLGIADPRLLFKAAVLRRADTQLGAMLELTAPAAARFSFSGDPAVTLTPGVLFSQDVGELRFGAKLAYLLRRRQFTLGIEQDDSLLLGLGANYRLGGLVSVLGEVTGRLGLGGRSFTGPQSPAEIDLGMRIAGAGMALDFGAGTGLWPGELGAGAPMVRGFLVLRAALERASCAPEDLDGYRDEDGCADPDNDRDGVPDAADACANDREDRDGFADGDGCPDLDNDADGIADARDLCPQHSEDADGFQDQDGCPEPDNDADGVADGVDRCRLDPEDSDDFEDDDGCPEPGPGQPTVTVSGSRLLMSDRVYFEHDADTLRAVSAPALDALAGRFLSLAGRPKLRVEGYSDETGNAEHDIDISYRRARAVVEYLKGRGVPAERLDYVGRGAADPLAPNSSAAGRALNRRVEFILVNR